MNSNMLNNSKNQSSSLSFMEENQVTDLMQKLGNLEKMYPKMASLSKPKSSLDLKTKFFNQCFDKGRLKNFVLWFLLNYGENETVSLVDQLKTIGFLYASKAGISLGIDDLKIPSKKSDLIYDAEKQTKLTVNQYVRGEITGIERFQRLIDTWHRTSEILKQEVIKNFESTDLLNPVYMMAFSGARGNISQVRQLVGMRGLMADPQGQILDFPIRSNFREGLTLTEYIISSYGARKGIVDTALRTANAGYLTRRLVDVAQHVIIAKFDCGTRRGIFLVDMKEGTKTIHSLTQRAVGRILARDLFIASSTSNDNTSKIKIASRNEEITSDLSTEIGKKFEKVFVRSPLTCETSKLICQLCYGWSLSQGNLVSIGEAVGVVAAQSIGEPGTQLTMRTFHTGGVFSGDISDQIRAPFTGVVEYLSAIPGTLIRTPEGKIVFLTKSEGSFVVHKLETNSNTTTNNQFSLEIAKTQSSQTTVSVNKKFKIPSYTLLFIRNGQTVTEKEVIAQISSISQKTNATDYAELTIKSEMEGQFYSQSLTFSEKEVGPKLNEKTSSRQLTKNSLSDEKIYEAWTWGYAWILSGKIYDFKYPSPFFTQVGDYLSSKSAMNQTLWKLSDTTGKRGNKLSYHTNAFSLNFPSLKSQRLIEKNSHFTRNEITAKLNNKETPCSISQSVLSFDLETSLFKKYGYYLKLSKKNQFLAISSTKSSSSLKNNVNKFKDNQDLVFFMKSLNNSFFPESNLSSPLGLKKPSASNSDGLGSQNRSFSTNVAPKADSSTNGKEKFKTDIPYFLQWFPSPTQTLTGGYAFSTEAPFLTSAGNEGGLSHFGNTEQQNLLNFYKNIYQSNRFILTSTSTSTTDSSTSNEDPTNLRASLDTLGLKGSWHSKSRSNSLKTLFNFSTRSISSTWKSSILKQLQAADMTENSNFELDKINKYSSTSKGVFSSKMLNRTEGVVTPPLTTYAKMYSQEFLSFKKSYFFGMRWKNSFSLWTDFSKASVDLYAGDGLLGSKNALSNEFLENKIMEEKHPFAHLGASTSNPIYWVPSEFFKVQASFKSPILANGFFGSPRLTRNKIGFGVGVNEKVNKKQNQFSTVLLKNTNSHKTNGFVNEKIPFLIQTNRQGQVKAFQSVMEENLSTFLISSFGFNNLPNFVVNEHLKEKNKIKVGLKYLKLKQTSRYKSQMATYVFSDLKKLSSNPASNLSLPSQMADNFTFPKHRFLSSQRNTYLKSLLNSTTRSHSKETNFDSQHMSYFSNFSPTARQSSLEQEVLFKAMFSNTPLLNAFESKFYNQNQTLLNFSHLKLSELTKLKQSLSMKKFKYHLTAQNLHSTSLKSFKTQKENFFIDQIKLCPFITLNTYCQILSLLFETNLTTSKLYISGNQSGSIEQQLKQMKVKNESSRNSRLPNGMPSEPRTRKSNQVASQFTPTKIKTSKKEFLLKNLQKFILVSNYLNKESQKVSNLKNKEKFALFMTNFASHLIPSEGAGAKLGKNNKNPKNMQSNFFSFNSQPGVAKATHILRSKTDISIAHQTNVSVKPLMVKSALCINKKVFLNPAVNFSSYDLTSLHKFKKLPTTSSTTPSTSPLNSSRDQNVGLKNQWSQKKGWVYCQKMTTNQKTATQLLNCHNKLIYPGQHLNFLCFDSPVILFTQCILLTADSNKNGAEESFRKQKVLKQSQHWNEKNNELLWVKNKNSRYYFTDEKSNSNIEIPSETQIGLFIQPIEEYKTIDSLEMKKHIFEGMSNTYTTLSETMDNLSQFKVAAADVRIERKMFESNPTFYVNKSSDSFLKWKQNQRSVFNKQEKTSQPYAMYPNSDFSLLPNSLFSESLSLAQMKTPFVSSPLVTGLPGQGVYGSTRPFGSSAAVARIQNFKFGSQKPLNLSSYMVLLSSSFGNISPFKHQSYSLNSLPLLKADIQASAFSSVDLLKFFNFYLDLTQLSNGPGTFNREPVDLKVSIFLSNPISKIYENPTFTFNTVFKFNTHLLNSEKTTFFKTNLKKHSHRNTALFPQNKIVTSTTQFTYDTNNDLHSTSIIAKTTDLSPFNGEIVYTNFANTGSSNNFGNSADGLRLESGDSGLKPRNGNNFGGTNEKSLDQTFVHKPSSNYNCMVLTKRDLISYYLPSQNFKSLLNTNLPKKYKINNIFVKQFLNTNELAKAGENNNGAADSSLGPRSGLTPNVHLKVSNLAAGTPQPFSSSLLGDFFVFGDLLGHAKAIQTSGQIIHYNNEKITLRRSQPIFISPKAILHKLDGDFIDPKSPVITLSYQRLKTGDIIQGIPKIEQFFEARTTKRGRLFRDSLPSLLKSLFKRYQAKLPLELAVRQSFYKIQQILVDGVQRVYKSQGVTIADKHLEVIVKQMTSKVRIVDGAQTGFFPGEVVDLEFVEKINKYLIKKITYEPLVLGITKASLEVDSFLSAASFQQTTRVLSKAAIYRKKDFLKGLKENVILGNLIPAGTGFLVYLDDNPTS